VEWSCSDEWMDVRGVQNRAEIIDELEDYSGWDWRCLACERRRVPADWVALRNAGVSRYRRSLAGRISEAFICDGVMYLMLIQCEAILK